MEFLRRLRRGAEVRRRLLLPLALIAFVALYLAPAAIRALFGGFSASPGDDAQPSYRLLARLERRRPSLERRDAVVWGAPEGFPVPPRLLAHVANGAFAVSVAFDEAEGGGGDDDGRLRVREGRSRTLSLAVPVRPVLDFDDGSEREGGARAIVLDFPSGVATRHSFSPSGGDLEQTIYAHRAIPSLLVQEVRLSNPTGLDVRVVARVRESSWPDAVERSAEVRGGSGAGAYAVRTGPVELPGDREGRVMAVSVATSATPASLSARPGGSASFERRTIVECGQPTSRERYPESAEAVERKALAAAERVAELAARGPLREAHESAWRRLWIEGLSISESKAADAVNGDRINATLYAALSQTRAPDLELDATSARRAEIAKALERAEGCYSGHFTLQADNLWKPLDGWRRIDAVVGAWLLTLEKRGCHYLIGAGASGTVRAMVLSFGGLRFANRHLEFDILPSDLHRDFHFRGVPCGNATRVDIRVKVQEDDTAALYASVEGSDGGGYYACDAGCLDGPVSLSSSPRRFPVKLTDPPTPVLYVASDRAHLEDLRHAIHVKEVAIAPPHERRVLALHRHGHALGGLPALFWASICLIIVVFHLFLCRIIMTEYCDPPDKYRRLNAKP